MKLYEYLHTKHTSMKVLCRAKVMKNYTNTLPECWQTRNATSTALTEWNMMNGIYFKNVIFELSYSTPSGLSFPFYYYRTSCGYSHLIPTGFICNSTFSESYSKCYIYAATWYSSLYSFSLNASFKKTLIKQNKIWQNL